MRRFLLTVVLAILIISLATLAEHRQPPKNVFVEIEPVQSFSFGATPSKYNGRLPQVNLPKSSLTAAELALIVNDADPQSIAVASYYQRQRHIPPENVVHIIFPTGVDEIPPSTFKSVKSQLDAALDPKIQAIALSFSRPFRVGCMSITAAFTLGYDDNFCQSKTNTIGCRYPKIVPYYNSDSVTPFTDFGIRPSMMLAGENNHQVFELIDRGVLSDKTFPKGVGYLVTTTDKIRSTRIGEFLSMAKLWNNNSGWTIEHLNNSAGYTANFITKIPNTLFYFTGLAKVPKIETNSYLPGAIADHLTSVGGILFRSPQMSVLNWLKAGVTASYGTVVEPCNFPEKFSNPEILVRNYYKGQTALEAYWKSVAAPQEGVFVGETLASPMGVKVTLNQDRLSLKLSSLEPGKVYQIYGADSPDGVYSPISSPFSIPNYQTVELNFYCDRLYYKLIEKGL